MHKLYPFNKCAKCTNIDVFKIYVKNYNCKKCIKLVDLQLVVSNLIMYSNTKQQHNKNHIKSV